VLLIDAGGEVVISATDAGNWSGEGVGSPARVSSFGVGSSLEPRKLTVITAFLAPLEMDNRRYKRGSLFDQSGARGTEKNSFLAVSPPRLRLTCAKFARNLGKKSTIINSNA
jgi:hypothetical protein